MRAAVLRAFGEPLAIEDLNLAPPGPDELRVRLTACAICHSDLHALAGAWGGPLPAVFGHEAAAIVLETGAGVEAVRPGDAVVVTLVRHCGACAACARAEPSFCTATFALDSPGPLTAPGGGRVRQGFRTGAFAEEAVVHQSQAVRVPPGLPPECAALLACGVLTGYGAVANTAAFQPGQTVAVFGAGGVGMNSIQAAAYGNAGAVIAVDVSDAKLALAARLGATHTINASHADPVAQIRNIAGPTGIDCAILTVVAEPVFAAALAAIRPGGAVILVGMAADGYTLPLDPTDIADRGIRIEGSKMGAVDPGSAIRALVKLHETGTLHLAELITGRYPFERINDALADARNGDAIRNVVLF